MQKEQVIHPEHYNMPGRKECWDEFIDDDGPEATFIWCLLTTKKYLYRKGLKDKNPAEQDIRKAFAYFNKADEIKTKYNLLGLYTSTYNTVYKELQKYVDR